MKLYQYTTDGLSKELNTGKDVLAHTLLETDVIDEAQFKIITEDFAILLVEKGFFGKTIAKVLNWTDSEVLYFKAVRVNNFNNKDKEDVHQSESSNQKQLDSGNQESQKADTT